MAFSSLDMQVNTSKCRSRSERVRILSEMYSTKKKSSFDPGATVSREAPLKPPIRLTPNFEEMKSRARKAILSSGIGRDIMTPHASSGVIDPDN